MYSEYLEEILHYHIPLVLKEKIVKSNLIVLVKRQTYFSKTAVFIKAMEFVIDSPKNTDIWNLVLGQCEGIENGFGLVVENGLVCHN